MNKIFVTFFICVLSTEAFTQNSYPASGNAVINSLLIGRYGTLLSGDSNPYNIYTNDGEAHDLTLYGSSSATLHLRLYDGDLKIGSNTAPLTTLFNNGNANFGGSIGIGTTTPYSWSRLHIKAPGANPWGIMSESSAGDKVIAMGHDGTNGVIAVSYLSSAGFSPLQLTTSNLPRLTIDVAGNVGIGIAQPSTRLAIAGALSVEETVLNVSNLSDQDFQVKLSGGGSSVKRTIIGPSTANRFSLGVGVGANNEHLTIINGGNVGIGTTTPSLKLHLATSNNLDGLGLHHSNGAWANFYSPSMTGGAYNGITQPGDAGVIFGNDGGLNTVSNGFVIAPHRNTTSGLRINSNGDVGIGTSSPDAKLAVNGQVHATEVKVTIAVPGPDYVFANNYQLPTLTEVETYIDQNKHLPEVPSATEMEKNGIQLGEMNMLLLKKIEEMTLYMIEQNKKLNTQNELILQQNERILKLENSKQN